MKNLELEGFGLVEMTLQENELINGGQSWWGCITTATADLCDGPAGYIAAAVFPGPCLLAIVVGGTINYVNQ